MKSEGFIKNDLVSMIDIRDEFDTSESMFLSNIFKNIRKKRANFKVQELNLLDVDDSVLVDCDSLTIPVLIIGTGIENIDINKNNYLGKTIKNEYYFNRKILNLYSKLDFFYEYKFSLGFQHKNPIINDNKYKDVYFIENSLFRIFNIGDILFVIPNINSFLYLKKDEFKKERKDGYYNIFKKTLLKKKVFIKDLISRKNEIKDLVFSEIRAFEKYTVDNLAVINYSQFMSSGIYLCFTSKENVDIINEGLNPFNISEENIFSLKKENELEKNRFDKKAYEGELNKQKKLFDKKKNKLEKKGFKWYSLDKLSKFDNGIWHIWLNPYDQYWYNYGWFTIEDLEDLLNDTGKIIKNKK